MARYQLTLAYDGAKFLGSQRQTKSDGLTSIAVSRPMLRTVQGELEKALRKLGWSGRSVMLAGRTDTGVHATGQVAAFDLDWAHKIEQLQKALNAGLPLDIVVRDIHETHADFHPRFDAASRRYVYRLFCDSVRHPLRERFAWRNWPEVNNETLIKVSKLFIGTHDFSAFGSPTTPKGSTVRTVMKSAWKMLDPSASLRTGGEWQFEVQADAFLYRMVRRMVFVQVVTAQEKCSVEEVQCALSGQTKLPAGLAPAHGLTLVEVKYDRLIELN
ncbi:MAG: tRNA pseudouridine(38-40) synthase TruA [Anaerolineales bacterium]|nr:tRNA pseudouridine(38-40) synthase TruA [Anaerolineales bacterium]